MHLSYKLKNIIRNKAKRNLLEDTGAGGRIHIKYEA